MDLSNEKIDSVLVVGLPVKRLYAANARDFRQSMATLLTGEPQVVLDLSGVTQIDSSALGAIVGCHRQLAEGQGALKLCGLEPEVRTLFQLVHLHRIFDVLNDREEALRAFAADPQ